MATTREQQVQRGYHYAIVDEVDSILIDEARTPLIISGPATVSTHQYDRLKPLVDQLVSKQNMLCNRLASEAKEAFDKNDNRRRRPPHVQGQARPAAQQAAPPHDGGPRKAQGDRQGRALVLPGHAQGGTLRAEGRALLHHRREIARSRSLRAGPRLPQSRRSRLLRPAGFDQRIHRHRSQPHALRRGKGSDENRAPGAVRQASRADSQHLAAAPRLLPLRKGRRIRRRGKQGRHRRRIHRPQNAGPPLERRLAPGRRGEGRRPDRSRNADPRHDHDPELFPPLREARGHDRHRRNRSERVPRHLQAGRRRHPDQSPRRAGRCERPHLQDASREIQRRHQRDSRAPRRLAAGPRRHGQRGSFRAAQPHAQARKNSAQRAEREISPCRRPRS